MSCDEGEVTERLENDLESNVALPGVILIFPRKSSLKSINMHFI